MSPIAMARSALLTRSLGINICVPAPCAFRRLRACDARARESATRRAHRRGRPYATSESASLQRKQSIATRRTQGLRPRLPAQLRNELVYALLDRRPVPLPRFEVLALVIRGAAAADFRGCLQRGRWIDSPEASEHTGQIEHRHPQQVVMS